MAEGAIPRLQALAVTVSNLMIGVFAFVPVLVLSFAIAPRVPLLLLFLTAVPSIWAQLRFEEKGWSVEFAQADRFRRMDLNGGVLTAPEYAREVRLLRLQTFFLERWRSLFRSAYDEVRRVRRRGALVVAGWSLLSGLGAGLPYVYVVAMTVNGAYSLGDLALYAGLVFQVRRSLFVLVGNAANLQEIALASAAIFRLLDMRPELGKLPPRTQPRARRPPAGGRRGGSGWRTCPFRTRAPAGRS